MRPSCHQQQPSEHVKVLRLDEVSLASERPTIQFTRQRLQTRAARLEHGKWNNVAQNDVLRLRRTPPFVRFLLTGWLYSMSSVGNVLAYEQVSTELQCDVRR
jgi:succinylglutamate desuccinylase